MTNKIDSQGIPKAITFNIVEDAKTGKQKYKVTTYYQLFSFELLFQSRMCAEFFYWEMAWKHEEMTSDDASMAAASANLEDLR